MGMIVFMLNTIRQKNKRRNHLHYSTPHSITELLNPLEPEISG